jgi:hypothetical protein
MGSHRPATTATSSHLPTLQRCKRQRVACVASLCSSRHPGRWRQAFTLRDVQVVVAFASHGTSNSSGAIVTMQPTEGRVQDDERGMLVREPHLSIFQPRKLLRLLRSSSCARLGVGKLSPLEVLLLYTLPQVATIGMRLTLRVESSLVFGRFSFFQHETAARQVPWLALSQPCTCVHMRMHLQRC